MLFRSNDTATTEIYTGWYTLSLHDALPIWYMFLGGAETTFNLDEGFERVQLGRTVCYQVRKA